MALQYVLFVATLFLSLDGLLCQSKKCYPLSIELCRSNNKNADGCHFHDKIAKCLKGLDDCNDPDRLSATQAMVFNQLEREQCKNLQDGECFSHEVGKCMKGLSLHLHGDIKDENCKAVDEQGDLAISCIKSLKKVCSSTFANKKIDTFVRDIMQRDADCWFREKYEKNHHG